jgi:hypothetical protein
VSLPLFERLGELFASLNWQAVPVNGEPIYGVTVRSSAGVEYTLVASTDEIASVLSFFARPPFPVPEHKREEAIGLFARVNFELNDGTWLVDPADGELRFRTAMQCGDSMPSEDHIRRTIGYALVGAEEHMGTIARFCEGQLSKEQAYEAMIFGTPGP